MLKVGLTGGISSGKSTICQLFSQFDIPIIDADVIARQLVEPGQVALDEIIDTFGTKVVQADGTLNRSSLRQLIFSDINAKKQLEAILHPKISQQLQQQSDAIISPYCILDIPLLIESNLQQSVNRILVVDVSTSKQIERLCQRDKISSAEAQRIINNQCSRELRLSYADDVISNNHSINDLNKIVFELDQKYRTLATLMTSGCQHPDSHGQ